MSQMNFFMIEEDERDFLAFVLRPTEVAFLVGRFHPVQEPPLVREVPAFGQPGMLELVCTAIRSPVVLSASGAGEFAGQYLLDMFTDPYIELSRSYFEAGQLRPGRIYTKIGWAEAHENDAMQRWYRSLASWLRGRYTKIGELYWVGPAAAEWIAAGGETSPQLKVSARGAG